MRRTILGVCAIAAAVTGLVTAGIHVNPKPSVSREVSSMPPARPSETTAPPAPLAPVAVIAPRGDRADHIHANTAAEPAPDAVRASIASAGMVVQVDPETGELGMPERQATEALSIEQLQALAHEEAAGLVTLRHPDGSESLEHEGRFTDFTVIQFGPDGKPTFRCVHGHHGVEHAMRSLPARDRGEEQ